MIFTDYYKDNIEKFCVDNSKYCCFLILVDIIVNYKGKVFIIRIKANMQYFFIIFF